MANISAGALAFAGIRESSWVTRAVLTGALGSSLCGVFALQILSIYATGFPNELLGARLAKGIKEASSWKSLVFAFTLACPAVVCVWTILLVLLGLGLFTFTLGGDENQGPEDSHPGLYGIEALGFKTIASAPVFLSFLNVLFTLGAVECMWRLGFGNDSLKEQVDQSVNVAGKEKTS